MKSPKQAWMFLLALIFCSIDPSMSIVGQTTRERDALVSSLRNVRLLANDPKQTNNLAITINDFFKERPGQYSEVDSREFTLFEEELNKIRESVEPSQRKELFRA